MPETIWKELLSEMIPSFHPHKKSVNCKSNLFFYVHFFNNKYAPPPRALIVEISFLKKIQPLRDYLGHPPSKKVLFSKVFPS